MASASVAGKSKQSKSDPNRGDGPLATATSDPNSSPAPLSRYESKKRRDWNTFLQYLRNHRPPITLEGCRCNHVIDFLRYLDQFGKTQVHRTLCPFFGLPDPPAPCPCPLRQAWGSLDALIGRLRLAYEEHGGSPESNPFATKAVRDYLSEVRECQAKARGNATGTGSDGDGSGSDASRASLSSTSANDQAQPSNNNMVRDPKARSRFSRRAPTTVLTTDSTNFRAMVQEFTAIPAPPFTSSPFPKSRLDLFGTSSSLRSSSSRDSPKLLKRQDWSTFLRYLGNQKPPITIAECSENHVLGFLKYLDQFGEVKVHYPRCLLFGHPNPVAACACPLWQASGSLDALIERLRSAYVEHGGRPESNPFAARAVWDYLSEVRESQAKARDCES